MQRDPVNSIDRHIGERIRVRRRLLRMSAAEAAAKLGVSEAVLAEFEAGLLRIDVRTLMRLVPLLGVRMRYFYDGLAAAAEPEAFPLVRRVND